MSFFTMIKPIIDITDLHKFFGPNHILSGLNLAIDKGTVYGLVGLNGAGKTTLLRLLLGLLKPDKGAIEIAGFYPWSHNEKFYSDCGVVLEHDGFWGNLTIKENLKIFTSAKKLNWKDACGYIDQFWGDTIITTSNKKVKHLSRGQRMQCALCRAFLGWPKIVFLDEPALALDMTAYDHFKNIIRFAKDNGSTIVISSHQLETIDDLCDRVGNLSKGVLKELEIQQHQGISQWVLNTDGNIICKDILLKNGCTKVEWKDGVWMFEVDNSEVKIPAIVKQLVTADFQIYEIKKRSAGFGDKIRSIYKPTDTKGNA